MHFRNRGWMVLSLFFCSGTTALVYEVVWSKFLSQMFGSTIYAQTVVLAAFMGGLALGNRLFGRWADRLQNPVQGYGILEVIIGIYAALFPLLNRAADWIFVSVGSNIADRPGVLLVLKGVLSAALLLGPTILMGGTLPLLAAWLQKFSSDPGRQSARFYSTNTLGAVLGAALAGFFLVQTFGMVWTLRLTALMNVLVGVAAIVLSRIGVVALKPAEPGLETKVASSWTGMEVPRLARVLVALTGAVSMGLEVLSARSLALIFGSSLQTFAVVLIAFILGIGLGSAWIASRRGDGSLSERLIVVLMCIAAAWVAVLVFNIEGWVNFYRIARTGFARTPMGYVFHELLTVGIALVILGLPAAWIGAVLPLMIRAVSLEGTPLGVRVGRLLTWNTLGAVAGTLVTGFVLMPLMGLRNAFGILALILAVIALMVAALRGWRIGIFGALAACVLAGSLFVFGDNDWQSVISSGMFRVRETSFDSKLMPLRKKHIKILFYEDGPDATVSVEQVDGIIAPAMIGLRINGKPDAGTGLDLSTQLLVSHLPMLTKPGAKDVFILGLASGMTAGALKAYPVERIDMAENCEPVIRASKFFDDWNHHVMDDPRLHLWREDARTVLKLHSQLYDVIITEPSALWTVGVGSVFSREFYELAASRLKPGGIMTQWIHIYETQDDIMDLILRTFTFVFPYVELWDAGAGDVVMLGSLQAWPTGPEVFRQGFALEQVRLDMAMIDIHTPEKLLGRQLASQRTAFAIAGPGPIQSDLFPLLEYAAPRAFYLGVGTRMFERYDERTRQQLLASAEKRAVLGSLPVANAQLIFTDFSTINGELYGCMFGAPIGEGVPCIFQTPNPAPPPAASGTVLDQAANAFAAGDLGLASQIVAFALNQDPDDAMAAYMSRVIERARR